MNLPTGIALEEILHGHSDCETVVGLEKGKRVVVKAVEQSGGLLGGLELDDAPSDREAVSVEFQSQKKREALLAEQTDYVIKGRLAKQGDQWCWVRAHMTRSLFDKVSFKEIPHSSELLGICKQITKALASIQAIDQSGHGNLSLGNVLLSGRGAKDLKLVDNACAHKRNDLLDKRGFGLIIYQLVNAEFVEFDDQLTSVPDDQEWNALGAKWRQWRDFCSELLSPYGKYANSSWEDIEKELQKLDAVFGKKTKVAVLLGLIILTCTSVVWYSQSREPEDYVVVDMSTIQGQWLDLLDAYFTWGEGHLRSLKEFEHADQAPALVERFYDRDKASLPTTIIAQVSSQSVRALSKSKVEAYEKARLIDVTLIEDEATQKQIVRAFQLFARIRSNIEQWEVIDRLGKSNEAFVASGFTFGASETQRLLDSISFVAGGVSLDRLYDLEMSVAGLRELQGLYDRLQEQLNELGQLSGSNYTALYAEGLSGQLKAPADNPVEHLRNLLGQAVELRSFWQSKSLGLEQEIFAIEEQQMLSELEFVASEINLQQWKSLVARLQIIDVPEINAGRDLFEKSGRELREWTEQINDLKEPGQAPVAFDLAYVQLNERFESDIDMPLIAQNQDSLKRLVADRVADLNALVRKAEDAWVEINPDIEERLGEMAILPRQLSAPLRPAWIAYIKEQILTKSVDSFENTRDFIVFQKAYTTSLRAFEAFQTNYLSQLPKQLPADYADALDPQLAESVVDVRDAYFEELVGEWVSAVSPQLFAQKKGLPLDESLAIYTGRLQLHDDELLAFVRLLQQGIERVESWEIPAGGFTSYWTSLTDCDLCVGWTQRSPFKDYTDIFRIYREIEKLGDPVALVGHFLAEDEPAFARFIALERASGTMVISYDKVVRVGALLPGLQSVAPASVQLRLKQLSKSLWMRAFRELDLSVRERETFIAMADGFGINATDLVGDSRVQYEVFTSLNYLRDNETLYLDRPQLLGELLNKLVSLPESSSNDALVEIVEALKVIELKKVTNTFENAAFLEKGWNLLEESEDHLVLGWGTYRLAFQRVKHEDGDFFLANSECSIGLFNDWMTQQKLWKSFASSIPKEWELFLTESYNVLDDYRRGMRLWTISRRGLVRGGLEPNSSWFSVEPSVMDEFSMIERDICPPDQLSDRLPMQHVGARLARMFAESMGMALPTPDQWRQASAGGDASGAHFWQSRFEKRISASLTREVRLGSFYAELKIASSGASNGESVLLYDVDRGGAGGFHHLAGNLAEYLYDPEKMEYSVAGGSSLSAVATTWRDVVTLTNRMESTAFSDVGLRLALIAPESSAYDQYLKVLEAHWN